MKTQFNGTPMLILTALALLVSAFGSMPAYAASGSAASTAAGESGISNHSAEPPPAPVFTSPPSFTNDTTPVISGTADEDSLVNVWYIDDLGSRILICEDVVVDDEDDDGDDEGDLEDDDGEQDDDPWSCVSSEVLPEREIELVANATGKSGRTSADVTYTFTVGSTAPQMPVITGPPAITNDTTPVISGTAEPGNLVNVWYLDDVGDPVQICQDVLVDQSGTWSCTSSETLPEREIELVVNATDPAGNTSNNASYSFTIDTTAVDTTPPAVSSITLASPNPTSSPTVNYTVSFSEPVVNVDSGDFTLDAGGTLTGATVSNVTGTGSTYTVTVNTGSGEGDLRLDVPVTATIEDLAGNPLGGLPFTSGETYTVSTTVQTFEAETIGVFRPSVAGWFLRNSNSPGAPDITAFFGMPGDQPIAGDWDGDGVDTIGVYRSGVFYLSNSNTTPAADHVFAFGVPGDQPVAGDWDGDGIDTVGVYRNTTIMFFLRNSHSSGAPSASIPFGIPGDTGVAGDWDGDGMDTIGVFRPSLAQWYFRNSNTSGPADVAITYGIAGDLPVIADWDTDGIDTVGVYRNTIFFLSNSNSTGFADFIVPYGNPGDLPLGENWDGLP